MRMIDGDTKITALLYNDEHEETERVEMSIADFLDGHTEEGCPQAVGGWISVKDRMPDLYERVLTYNKNNVRENWLVGRGVEWSQGYNITHWMPLPEPPKGE